MYAVAPISPQAAPSFLELVKPFFQPLLEDPADKVLAFGVSFHGQRVGVALAQLKPKLCHAELVYVFIAPEHRRKGNASTMLKRMETELVDRGILEMIASFNPQAPDFEVHKAFFAKQGWQPPKPSNLVVQSDLDHLAEAPWLHTELEAGFEIFDWADLTEEEADELSQSQAAEAWVPSDLFPLSQSEDLHAATSIGLRHDGKVIGWVLTFQWDERTLYLRASYVHPRFQKTGQILPMYREVARRMGEVGLFYALWVVPLQHDTMVKFAKRRMAPHCTTMVETWGAKKVLESW